MRALSEKKKVFFFQKKCFLFLRVSIFFFLDLEGRTLKNRKEKEKRKKKEKREEKKKKRRRKKEKRRKKCSPSGN